MPVIYLDGPRLKHAVVAGAQRLISMQEQLNNINVFPVPDADTGTNMALTMSSVAQGALNCNEASVHAMSVALADSALMGARGNSGAILAQFFQGLSEGFHGKARSSISDFAHAVDHAARVSREAIAEPREGTILTVIQDWARYIHETWEKVSDFPTLIRQSLRAATDSLQRTPEKLKVLARAGVVDAGAQGFVHLLEGVTSFMQSGKIERLARGVLNFANAKAKVEEAPETITFRYCTQAFVVGQSIDRHRLKARLQSLGDSMIVAGSNERVRLHIHTNEPEKVFALAREYGELRDARHDDMRNQHTRAHHDPEKQTVAIITDSSCDLPPEEFIKKSIRMVPVLVIFGNQSYVDKVTITDRDFYRMLAASPKPPTTSQPAPADFREVYLQAGLNHREALAIILSGSVSGTLQAAARAAEMVKNEIKVHVMDSKNVTIGLGLIVREAAELAAAGAGVEEIRRRVEWAIRQVRTFVSVETMTHLVRGGRVSRFRGLVASVLNLKPILTLNSAGKPEVVAKTMGGRAGHRKLLEIVKKEAAGKRNLRFMVAHASAPDTAEFYADHLRQTFEAREIPIVSVSPALGAHAGPAAAAIAFLGE
ncbi:MAG: DAK2 domain-containing protein [bacterium]